MAQGSLLSSLLMRVWIGNCGPGLGRGRGEKIHEVLSNNKEGGSQGRLPGISGYRVQLFRKKKKNEVR